MATTRKRTTVRAAEGRPREDHRDFSATKEFFNWRKTVIDGKVSRKSVSIILLNDAGEEALRYNLFECWPTKYHGPALNSRNSAHATESIELASKGWR